MGGGQTPVIPDWPPPRPMMTAVLIGIALALLLLGYTKAGTVFVGAALASSLWDLFRGGRGGPSTPGGSPKEPPGSSGTSAG
jgi:hypothetical protein